MSEGKTGLGKKAKFILQSARPRQWLKNSALFAAPYLRGVIFEPRVFVRVLSGAGIFCLLTSAVYLFNDIQDRKKDQKHPLKKNRPVASGKLSVREALAVAAILLSAALYFSSRLSPYFMLMVISYAALQITYSTLLRDVIILDALAIALGFIFRVFAGAFIVPVSISSWLILTTIGLALLMAFGKRRSEKTLLETRGEQLKTREALRGYPNALLDSTISTFAASTIISYSLYAFHTSPTAEALPNLLPVTLATPKWTMLTIPIVIYGVARYLYVIYEKGEAESPDKVLLSDFPLLISVLLWVVTMGIIIYCLGAP